LRSERKRCLNNALLLPKRDGLLFVVVRADRSPLERVSGDEIPAVG
jgi:hypothetical protein